MCSGPRENGHNVRKLSEKFANISIPQSSSPQHTRNASHTHITLYQNLEMFEAGVLISSYSIDSVEGCR